MRLVHHRDDVTLTSNRLVSGNIFHFEPLNRRRNVVLGGVVRGEFLGEVVGHVLRQHPWQILRDVTMVVGGSTGLAALNRYAPASMSAGHIERKIQVQELRSERKPVRGVR